MVEKSQRGRREDPPQDYPPHFQRSEEHFGRCPGEGIRYTRYLQTRQKRLDDTIVDNLVTAFVNLLSVEAALYELKGRIGQR